MVVRGQREALHGAVEYLRLLEACEFPHNLTIRRSHRRPGCDGNPSHDEIHPRWDVSFGLLFHENEDNIHDDDLGFDEMREEAARRGCLIFNSPRSNKIMRLSKTRGGFLDLEDRGHLKKVISQGVLLFIFMLDCGEQIVAVMGDAERVLSFLCKVKTVRQRRIAAHTTQHLLSTISSLCQQLSDAQSRIDLLLRERHSLVEWKPGMLVEVWWSHRWWHARVTKCLGSGSYELQDPTGLWNSWTAVPGDMRLCLINDEVPVGRR